MDCLPSGASTSKTVSSTLRCCFNLYCYKYPKHFKSNYEEFTSVHTISLKSIFLEKFQEIADKIENQIKYIKLFQEVAKYFGMKIRNN